MKKEEAADLTGEFTFEVDDITRHQPAELNQEFFDKVLGVGAVSDEEQFRAKVADVIRGNYVRESAQLLRLDILKNAHRQYADSAARRVSEKLAARRKRRQIHAGAN